MSVTLNGVIHHSFNPFVSPIPNLAFKAQAFLAKSSNAEKLLKLFRYSLEQYQLNFGKHEGLNLIEKLFKGTAKQFGATAITQDLRYWVSKWGETLENPETAELSFFKRRWLPPASMASTLSYHLSHVLKTITFARNASFESAVALSKRFNSIGVNIDTAKNLTDFMGALLALVNCTTELKRNYITEVKRRCEINGEDPEGDALYLDIARNSADREDGFLLDLEIKFRAFQQAFLDLIKQGHTPIVPNRLAAAFFANSLWIFFSVASFGLTSYGVYPFIFTSFMDVWHVDTKESDIQQKEQKKHSEMKDLARRVPENRHIPESLVRYSNLLSRV